MKYNNGDIYEGDFRDDMRNGNGTLRYANQSIYSGEFLDDVENGFGLKK